jgi:undecaprenol kinase/diacylglycerol kinase (ATP)
MKNLRLVKSFRYALRGLAHVAKTELSFQIQLAISVVVVLFMFAFPLMTWQRIILILLIAAVLILEVINTIFERIVDTFKARVHPVVGEVKDMMAAAVLIASTVAAIVGLLIFLPYLTY